MTAAEVLLYNEIGPGGTDAVGFTAALRDASGPVHVRLNSPGGDVFDGIAIYNALAAHPHHVSVTVDGLAASAASFIAMAGDEVAMNRGAQMMIHDAWGGQVGNAQEMRRIADLLDRHSDQIASLYAGRAGGTVGQWRDAMRVETWYSAEEAVAARLADKVVQPRAGVRNLSTFDLGSRGWRYAGRRNAPPPKLRNADQVGVDTEPGDGFDMSDDDYDQALDALLMDMYHDIHHLGDLAEAMHAENDGDGTGGGPDDGTDSGGAGAQALWRPRGAHIGFDKLTAMLAARGAANPAGLARYIGQKKLGHAGFAAKAAAGRVKRAARHAEHDASNQLADFDPDVFRRTIEEASK